MFKTKHATATAIEVKDGEVTWAIDANPEFKRVDEIPSGVDVGDTLKTDGTMFETSWDKTKK